MKQVKNYINDTALIFEGGGMRAAYTAGALNVLLEEGLNFKTSYGTSAGASHVVNYLSGDERRAKESFTTFVDDPDFGGMASLLQGKGYFSSNYIYQEAGKPDGQLPYDFEAFKARGGQARIQALDAQTGKTVVWSEKDLKSLDDLMVRVRASSTLPFFMPPTVIDGKTYFDGGLAPAGGIQLRNAEDEGFKKFLFILTNPRGHRSPPAKRNRALEIAFKKFPSVIDGVYALPSRHNAIMERVEDLEASGRALVFYSENQSVTIQETSRLRLLNAYNDGYAQAHSEVDTWKEFLL